MLALSIISTVVAVTEVLTYIYDVCKTTSKDNKISVIGFIIGLVLGTASRVLVIVTIWLLYSKI